jgi:hypothetical protein
MRPAVALISALAALLAAVPAAAKPGQRYRFSVSGHVTVTHNDTGLQANGADCGLNTPDATSPFEDHTALTVSWRSSFVVPVDARGRPRTKPIKATTTRVSGTFSYSGFAWSFSCHEIVYGPGGQPCTGSLRNGGGPGLITARRRTRGKRLLLKLLPTPFGPPVANPASCTVDTSPAVTYTASDELNLPTLGTDIAHHWFTLPEVAPGHKALSHRIRRTVDCSQPAQSAGETDTCSTTYAGAETLRVTRG